jgi:integrase/recombinase XerD
MSKNTIENYSFDIERLCLYLEQNSIAVSPIAIDDNTVQQFFTKYLVKSIHARKQE